MNKDSRIFVAGHRGLVGSALCRELRAQGYEKIITVPRKEIDLRDREQVKYFFSVMEPEVVFLCAAKVGGIKAHGNDPLGFFLDNMNIEQNVICESACYGVKKLVFLGSSCIYPRDCPQPIKEDYLLTGPLEKSNEPYALAKIAGVKLCQWYYEQGHDFVATMPCNLYGLGDSINLEDSHIIPGLIARMHRAKVLDETTFAVWGDGTAKREFLFSQDLAKALIVVANRYSSSEPINTGSSDERTVAELARLIQIVVGYTGKLVFDSTEPTGTPRKVLNNSKIFSYGWTPHTSLEKGLVQTYEDVLLRLRTTI